MYVVNPWTAGGGERRLIPSSQLAQLIGRGQWRQIIRGLMAAAIGTATAVATATAAAHVAENEAPRNRTV